MSLNYEPWLPVMTRSGQKIKISPQQLPDDDIIELAYPRSDFQGGAYQFLIGLLQTAYAPEDEENWAEIWREGLDSEAWRLALGTIAVAMQFGPQKPAFLQDFSTLESENSSISGLLVDSPGGNTLKLNKDHFVKRSSYQRFCPHCVVMALFTVQTNSPAAGAGFRTSMRGGGPMTTLMMPQNRQLPLWKKLWLNVLPQQQRPSLSELPLIFPWLTYTHTSEKAGSSVTPENAHPLQAYWGMPRRIEIDFTHTEAGNCDLCGELHSVLLTQIRNKNYGVQYEGWLHPLSPYRQAIKAGAPLLSLKGQPGGLAYKDWLGLALGTEDKFNRTLPAEVVREQRYRRLGPAEPLYLWCFGFDMDNAKARCWYEHHLPNLAIGNAAILDFTATIALAIALATGSLSLLKTALKEAWFAAPKEAKGDFSALDIAYWQETETDFRTLLSCLTQALPDESAAARAALRQWEAALHQYLFATFDRLALNNPDDNQALLRVLSARRLLDRNYTRQKVLKDLQTLMDESKEVQSV
ncbi:type I-E CRISPR-associated protein Cse1/CasA [Serratia ureilytica]|uniref:type I-E CRISPR-associated protein Cse1/CasA n=1 Tax=Serratia ureilytica TaxID=300181 RepID=UPI001D19510D|nr:type I-E CRISPR-associated protein Cse1/CasA [Serratia ureilytica]MCC4106763.1 type I-E CRISPR-associated protein Cse1/CasA [Serratia ureilytica]